MHQMQRAGRIRRIDWHIDLHDKSRDLLKREVDIVLLLKPDVTIKVEEQGFNKSRARADGALSPGGGRCVPPRQGDRPRAVVQ